MSGPWRGVISCWISEHISNSSPTGPYQLLRHNHTWSLLYSFGNPRAEIGLLFGHVELFDHIWVNEVIKQLQMVLRRILMILLGTDMEQFPFQNVNELVFIFTLSQGFPEFLLEMNNWVLRWMILFSLYSFSLGQSQNLLVDNLFLLNSTGISSDCLHHVFPNVTFPLV